MLLDNITAEVAGSVAGVLTAAFIAWSIGHRLSAKWNLRQKRRELSLAATADFSKLYGQFFAIWKLWNYSIGAQSAPSTTKWDLLKKVTEAEAEIEALLVQMSAQARLSDLDIEVAGKFRQGYQQLRQHIRAGKKLDWNKADHSDYLAFKNLAATLAIIVSCLDRKAEANSAAARDSLVKITSNDWEAVWTKAIGSP